MSGWGWGRTGSLRGRPGGRSVGVGHGEGAFAARSGGEGDGPAEHRSQPAAEAGEEGQVDEEPDEPAGEAREVQRAGLDHGLAAGDVGGAAEIQVLEGLRLL